MSYEIKIENSQTSINEHEDVVQTIIVDIGDINVAHTPAVLAAQNMTVGQVVYQCSQCDYYSFDKDILKRHIGLIHERKPAFECMLCYAVFVDPKKLKQHKAYVHKGKIFVEPL